MTGTSCQGRALSRAHAPGLAALDGKDVVPAAAGQVAGVLALGVPRAGGDDRAAGGDPVQQHGQHRDLAGLRPGPGLAQHHPAGVVQGGGEVPAVLAASGRAA